MIEDGGEGEGGVAVVEEVGMTVEEGTALRMGKTDSEVMVHHRILEEAPPLLYLAMDLGEGGEKGDAGFLWEEGEDFVV